MLPHLTKGKCPQPCDEGTQDSNIKTILFILRTIDTEEGRLGRTGADPYILKPETGTSNHVTMSVSATSWLDRHKPCVSKKKSIGQVES
jgi:hypothetical protein